MSNTKTLVDVEGPVRAWLRTQSIAGLADRVFLGLPERCSYPAADVQLMDGGIQPGEAPMVAAVFTASIWGGSRNAAADAAWAFAQTVENLTPGTTLDSTLTGLGGQVTLGPLFRPDPDGRARYLVDFTITAKPA